MLDWVRIVFIGCVLTLLTSANVIAENTGSTSGPPALENDENQLLFRMYNWIRESQELDFKTTFHLENAVQGQKVNGTAHYQIKRPASFRVEVHSNKEHSVFVSDGKSLTIYEPAHHRYALLEADDSIMATMFKAIGILTLQARMVEFFWTVDYLARVDEDVRIERHGTNEIGGKSCRKFAVKRFEEEWTVWIQEDGNPVLCRLISRKTDQSAFTVQTNDFSWSDGVELNSALFVFEVPANVKKVHPFDLE